MAISPENKYPFVSIIVPCYNAEAFIRKCLDGLLAQDYPRDKLEIFIIDNGSTDRTPDIIREYGSTGSPTGEGVKLLFERNVQSSYAARNRGVERARGEVFAFTDPDCIPETTWVSEGVRCLAETGADMAGGRVRMIFKKTTGAELFDSFSHLDNESFVRDKQAVQTANLFARRRIFEDGAEAPLAVFQLPAQINTAQQILDGVANVLEQPLFFLGPMALMRTLMHAQHPRLAKAGVNGL